MNTFLGHIKLHLFWSSFTLSIIFTFIILYSSNSFQTKHHHAPNILNSPKGTISVAGECRLFEGKWVHEPEWRSSLPYTNGSCATMPDSKNCFKNGRVDTEFWNWKWKPNGCELPRFDPAKFLNIVRGKTMGFIGDSVSRNHVDSLLCLLSKVIHLSFPI